MIKIFYIIFSFTFIVFLYGCTAKYSKNISPNNPNFEVPYDPNQKRPMIKIDGKKFYYPSGEPPFDSFGRKIAPAS